MGGLAGWVGRWETREEPKLLSNQRKRFQGHTAAGLLLLQSKRALQLQQWVRLGSQMMLRTKAHTDVKMEDLQRRALNPAPPHPTSSAVSPYKPAAAPSILKLGGPSVSLNRIPGLLLWKSGFRRCSCELKDCLQVYLVCKVECVLGCLKRGFFSVLSGEKTRGFLQLEPSGYFINGVRKKRDILHSQLGRVPFQTHGRLCANSHKNH